MPFQPEEAKVLHYEGGDGLEEAAAAAAAAVAAQPAGLEVDPATVAEDAVGAAVEALNFDVDGALDGATALPPQPHTAAVYDNEDQSPVVEVADPALLAAVAVADSMIGHSEQAVAAVAVGVTLPPVPMPIAMEGVGVEWEPADVNGLKPEEDQSPYKTKPYERSDNLIKQLIKDREEAEEATASAVAYADVDREKRVSPLVAAAVAGMGQDSAKIDSVGDSLGHDIPAPLPQAQEPQPPHLPHNPKEALQLANQIKDKSSRDRTLFKAFQDSRQDLEEAENLNKSAMERLTAAKEVYEFCAQLLAGYTPLEARLNERKRKKQKRETVTVGTWNNVGITVPEHMNMAAQEVEAKQHPIKLGHHEPELLQSPLPEPIVGGGTAISAMQHAAAMEGEPIAPHAHHAVIVPFVPRVRGQVQPTDDTILPPTNEIYLPEYFTSGGCMTEEMVSSFRDNFYLQLTKGQAGSATIDSWAPPPNNANLKSNSQLAEWIHIATHWNTGADGLDAGAFRAKHKTWYSRMKPKNFNLGRRTGMHLRQLEDAGGDVEGMMVLCRYNKAGNKSIVYLDVGRLFDALFQVHVLELNHRGRDATKNLVDERFANIPDATVRAFLDTCPLCAARRGHGHGHMVGISAVPAHNIQPSLGV